MLIIVYAGQQARILGENYTIEDEEDSRVGTVSKPFNFKRVSVKSPPDKIDICHLTLSKHSRDKRRNVRLGNLMSGVNCLWSDAT